VPINNDLLQRGLAALSLPPEGSLFDALARYTSEIEAWNPAYGLVGATGDELIVKHILDSLAPLAILRAELSRIAAGRSLSPGFGLAAPRMRMADLGTGAGLPGIPLALALSEVDTALIDRMGKRIRFLESQTALLGLANASVIQSEVERAPGSYDLVTFRAFRPFERKLFKSVFALCETDGVVFAYKGKREKAEAELSEIAGLYSSARIVTVEVPFLDEDRCVVMLEPTAAI
jgi:16S rRNA (guanine527-N7)-methyltransferase